MKNKKKWILLAGAVLAVILALTLIFIFAGRSPTDIPETESDTSGTVNVSDISIEEPEKPDDTASDTTAETDESDGNVTLEKIPDGAGILTPDESADEGGGQQTGEKPNPAEQPVEPKPLPDESGNGGGIVIGGGEAPKPYSCGVEGHHCSGPETHAYILNLELEGCEYCGSHNCPSFYGTDEWGNGGLFPKLCPKYDMHKDPVYYCQTCGKKCWDGTNGTCVQFVNSDNCPMCGEWVEGWTCHSCK